MDAVLLIAYRSPNGVRALPVAEVDDRDLLVTAARRAITGKRSEVDGLNSCDPELAMLAAEEADRLERALGLLIPELRGARRTATPALAM